MADTETGTLYRYGIKITPKGNHDLQFKRPKLEIGTVATDWSPAPEDPDEELYERISVLQTDFSVVQGQIQAKVWETDIEKATDGLYESMEEIYAYINETVNGISASVGDLTYTVENNYASLTAQISDLVITDDSITSRVYEVEQQLEGILGKNILSHTEDMDMETPHRNYYLSSSHTTATLDDWNVYASDSLPVGKAYAIATGSLFRVSSSGQAFTMGVFHWDKDMDILSSKAGKIVAGETYTFSFYLACATEDAIRIYTNYTGTISNRTIINASHPIVSYVGSYDYMEIETDQNLDNWQRVWITFTLDNEEAVENFSINFSYGIYESENYTGRVPEIYLCGLMLNEGDAPLDWDNGELTFEIEGDFATTSYVASAIEQATDSILATVVDIQVALNGDISALYADLQILSDSINATVGNVEVTVDNYYTETMEKIASLQIETDAISSTVANIQSNIYEFLDPRNLLLHTDSTDFEMPYDGYINETYALTDWTIHNARDASHTQPVGTVYAVPQLRSFYTVIETKDDGADDYYMYCGGFHWTRNAGILSDNIDKLIEGETYTFSFYMALDLEDMGLDEITLYLLFDRIVYGQTVLNCSLETFENTAGRVGSISIESQLEWHRIWVTFRLDDKANFKFGPQYGYSTNTGSFYTDLIRGKNAYFCGFMLNEGATVATWDDGEQSAWATTDWVYSQIQQLSNSITLSVTSKSNGAASIVLSVDGEETGSGDILANGTRYAFANDTSAITISAGTVTFNSNTFIVNSTYFSVTANGTITATAGTIGGWTISTNALYSGVSDITDMNTTGILLLSGTTGGIRVNYENLAMLLRYARLEFQHANMQSTTAYISGNTYYVSTGVWGLRLAGLGVTALHTPWFLMGSEYVAPGNSGTGAVGFTGSFSFLTSAAGTTQTMYFRNGICYG